MSLKETEESTSTETEIPSHPHSLQEHVHINSLKEFHAPQDLLIDGVGALQSCR